MHHTIPRPETRKSMRRARTSGSPGRSLDWLASAYLVIRSGGS
jgi:hypothetical protein